VVAEVTAVPRRSARAGVTLVRKQVESQRVHEQRRYMDKLGTRDLEPPIEILWGVG